VNTAALSVSTLAGIPQRTNACWKVCSTSGPVMVRRGVLARHSREWSSSRLRISTPVPSASCQWVVSACHRWLGCSAVNRCHDERGRFCGWGVTKPRRVRIRQIVATDGTAGWVAVAALGVRRTRWVRMVSAPASSPCRVSSLRIATI